MVTVPVFSLFSLNRLKDGWMEKAWGEVSYGLTGLRGQQ